jgi:hypothetical protein
VKVIEEPKPSPYGKRLVYCRSNGGSSLWLLELARVSKGPVIIFAPLQRSLGAAGFAVV